MCVPSVYPTKYVNLNGSLLQTLKQFENNVKRFQIKNNVKRFQTAGSILCSKRTRGEIRDEGEWNEVSASLETTPR